MTTQKRQKEMKRLEKRKMKEQKRTQRKMEKIAEKESGRDGPEIGAPTLQKYRVSCHSAFLSTPKLQIEGTTILKETLMRGIIKKFDPHGFGIIEGTDGSPPNSLWGWTNRPA